MKYLKTILTLAALLVPTVSSINAQTIFNGLGGDITNAANWSAGAPAAGNDGTINSGSGTANGFIGLGGGALTLNITGGTLSGNNLNLQYYGAGRQTWNQSGGTFIVTANQLLANQGIDYNLSGGLLDATSNTIGGTANGGTFTLSLAGTATAAQLSMSGGSNFINILSNWTGSITNTGFNNATQWESLIETTQGFKYNGAVVTDYTTNFQVTNSGQTLSLLVVPEPGTVTMLGLAFGMTLAMARRRRQNAA